MTFLHGAKKSLAKLGKSAVLVLAGVAIGVVGFLLIAMLSQPNQYDLDAIKLDYTVKYIDSEQARIGIDCHALRKITLEFLTNNVQPVLKDHQLARNWSNDIDQVVRKRMGDLREYYFVCGSLYRAAQNANWNGFSDLEFSITLREEIITLNTIIRFGEFGKECDDSCLETNFRDLQNAVTKLAHQLTDGDIGDSKSSSS